MSATIEEALRCLTDVGEPITHVQAQLIAAEVERLKAELSMSRENALRAERDAALALADATQAELNAERARHHATAGRVEPWCSAPTYSADDLQHALGVRDAAMEAEDKAEAERDALRAQRDALQATLCDLSAAFDKRGAQRDAAVEALLSRCPYHDEGEDGLPPHTQNKGDRDKTYPCDLSEMELAALLLARGTP